MAEIPGYSLCRITFTLAAAGIGLTVVSYPGLLAPFGAFTPENPIDRFHNSWVGRWESVREWLEQFVQSNHQRPHQALAGKTPVEVVQN